MKKILLYATALLVTTMLWSCKDDAFLELNPLAKENTNTFYLTKDGATKGVNACYTPMQWESTFSKGYWTFGDVASDDAVAGGSGLSDQPFMQDINMYKHQPTNEYTTAYWKALYIGIYRCNQITDFVPDATFAEKDKNTIIGQAKFLRAFYFFNLMTVYGPIPVFDHVLLPDELKQGQGTWPEVYDRIETDLKSAIDLLPERSQYSGADLGRATKGSAKALLAKFYMFISSYQKYGANGMYDGIKGVSSYSKWQSALDLCEDVINSGEYQLLPNYADVFKLSNENNAESIFEIQFMADNNTFYHDFIDGSKRNISQGSFISRYQVARWFKYWEPKAKNNAGDWRKLESVLGWGFDLPRKNLWDEYKEVNSSQDTVVDSRRSVTMASNLDSMLMEVSYLGQTKTVWVHYDHLNNSLATGYSPKKYALKKEEMNWSDNGLGHSQPKNIIYMRYADVILLAAEAAMELGQTAKAKDYLKMIRNRAGLSDYPEDPRYADLKEAIYHERRVELAMEAHRWFDLVRWGRAATILQYKGFVAGKNERFPIPASEVQMSGGLLKQNPGY